MSDDNDFRTRLRCPYGTKTRRTWSLRASKAIELFVLRDKEDTAIVAASFSKDGKRLVTGNMGGWVTIRSATDFARDYRPFLPNDAVKLSINAMLAVTAECETDEDYRQQLKIAENVCDHFPYYLPFSVRGIAQFRLGQVEESIVSLEEARRLEPIIYGEPDLPPNIEGYLILAYLKAGQFGKAEAIRTVFNEKCDSKIWNEFERITTLQKEVNIAFKEYKLANGK